MDRARSHQPSPELLCPWHPLWLQHGSSGSGLALELLPQSPSQAEACALVHSAAGLKAGEQEPCHALWLCSTQHGGVLPGTVLLRPLAACPWLWSTGHRTHLNIPNPVSSPLCTPWPCCGAGSPPRRVCRCLCRRFCGNERQGTMQRTRLEAGEFGC